MSGFDLRQAQALHRFTSAPMDAISSPPPHSISLGGFRTPALGVQGSVTHRASIRNPSQELSFRHAICGHGPPARDTAKEAYTARFQRVFGAG
jgi:hypothetical protein